MYRRSPLSLYARGWLRGGRQVLARTERLAAADGDLAAVDLVDDIVNELDGEGLGDDLVAGDDVLLARRRVSGVCEKVAFSFVSRRGVGGSRDTGSRKGTRLNWRLRLGLTLKIIMMAALSKSVLVYVRSRKGCEKDGVLMEGGRELRGRGDFGGGWKKKISVLVGRQ